jgi:hypothetical protein
VRPFAHAAVQEPGAGTGGWWSTVVALAREPGVAEVLLATLVVGAAALVWWRYARLGQQVRARSALLDYLLGAEQALHGDLDGAHARLARVVRTDPENHYARLLLGKVLTQRGEPEAAHQQHVCLRTAFGVDTAENDLLLAQSLLAAGLPREAADTAERALGAGGGRAAGWRFVYRARLQSGDFAGACAAGRRLLELLPPGAERDALAVDVARATAQTGGERLTRGDAAGARELLHAARRLAPDAPPVALLAARVDAHERGLEHAVRALLTGPDPVAATSRALVAVRAQLPAVTAATLPAATFAGLAPPRRWACRCCRAPLAAPGGPCPRCDAPDAAEATEPRLVETIDSAARTMDAIDVNDAHLARLVAHALDGSGRERELARAELLALRERAVTAVLRAAWHTTEHRQDAAIEVLRAMGPGIAPALFAASDALGEQRVLPLGSRSPAALVGRVVQGFDRAALPHVEPLFASARPAHRKILIDFFLGLADPEQFQLVLERFAPIEIVHRLNKADAAVLIRFLQAVPGGHATEALLRDGTFYRDEELLAAIAGAADPRVLHAVYVARGASRAGTKVALAALADLGLADAAERVLADLGDGPLRYVLQAFADPECDPAVRPRLRRLLVRCGAAAAAALCDGFGPEPTALDDELRELLAAIGDAAVAPLQAAYEHSGWLEKVGARLVSRHTNRRVQVVLALQQIGSGAAVAALRALAQGERDSALRARLQHALEGGGHTAAGGADGPAR